MLFIKKHNLNPALKENTLSRHISNNEHDKVAKKFAWQINASNQIKDHKDETDMVKSLTIVCSIIFVDFIKIDVDGLIIKF